MRPRQIVAFAAVCAIAVLLVYLFVNALRHSADTQRQACRALAPESISGKAPAFSLPDLGGKRRGLKGLHGKVVLLHFWATWCPPCLEELPSLFQLQRRLTDPDFELLTVSVDDSAAVVKRFFSRNKLPQLPVLVDPSRATPKSYGTDKFPETYLIDRSGQLVYRFVNKRNWGSASALSCLQSRLRR